MSDLFSLTTERLKKLSRSSIFDVSEKLVNPGPNLLKKIIKQDSGNCEIEALAEGHASLSFTNGNTYKGNIKDGMLVDQGTLVWSDGTIYKGEFKNGEISGKGEYTWNDGSQYVGGVYNGLRHGTGILYDCNGNCVYNGEWINGRKQGKGKMIFNGQNNSFYEGEWLDDQQNGYGIRKYESGNFYEGNWKDSRRHGNGIMHWVQQREVYSGEWKDGAQNGKGEHVWYMNQTDNSQYPVCNRYNGEWVNGNRHGQGVFCYASGGSYEGFWSSNKKQGKGKHVLPNGRVIEGDYREDRHVSHEVGRMAKNTATVSAIARPKTPLGSLIGDIDGSNAIGSTTHQFNMGVSTLIPSSCDVTLELQKVHCVVLRYLTQLKRSYHYYSTLVLGITDHTNTGKNVLKRIQLWQLLSDCRLYNHCITVTEANTLMQKAIDKSDDSDNLLTPFLIREFLQCIVFIAYQAYSRLNSSLDWCLDQFMVNDFIPNVCKLKGLVFQYRTITSTRADEAVQLHKEMLTNCDGQPTLRDFILFLNNRKLTGSTDSPLSVKQIVNKLVELHPLAMDGEDYNLNKPMTFLEFHNMLIACSIIHYKNGCQETASNEHHLQDNNSQPNTTREEGENVQQQDDSCVETVNKESVELDRRVTFEDQVTEEERIESKCEDNIAQATEDFFVLLKTGD